MEMDDWGSTDIMPRVQMYFKLPSDVYGIQFLPALSQLVDLPVVQGRHIFHMDIYSNHAYNLVGTADVTFYVKNPTDVDGAYIITSNTSINGRLGGDILIDGKLFHYDPLKEEMFARANINTEFSTNMAFNIYE